MTLDDMGTRIDDVPEHMRTGAEYWLVTKKWEPGALLQALVPAFQAEGWKLGYSERLSYFFNKGGKELTLCVDTSPTGWCRRGAPAGQVTYEGPRWPPRYRERLIVEVFRAR